MVPHGSDYLFRRGIKGVGYLLKNLKGFAIYLTPFIPLSWTGEGEILKEGLAPLLNALIFALRRVKERQSLSYQNLPPLPQGRGGYRG